MSAIACKYNKLEKLMKNKRIILMLLVAVISVFTALSVFADETGTLLISPKPEEPKVSFTDIPEDAAYKEAVYKLVENGVLNGYPDGTFRPAGNLTRAELCKMINLSMGYTDTTDAAGFPDLVTTEWYMPYVLAAQKAGYILGDDTGIFRPDDNITRQEVCAILCRVLKPFDLQFEVTINDTVDDWAKDYVRLIVQNGLMPLEEGGTFRATEPIRRFELAVAVAPFSQKVDEVKCTVTYNVDGVLTTEQVVIGKTNPNPLVLTTAPEGYKHVGWSLDPAVLVPIDTATYLYLEDVTLYPVYEKITYTVTFIAGTITVDTQTVKHGEFATLPNAPAMKGYTFKGWAPGKDGKVVDVAKHAITAETVFTAVFISADSGGGGGFAPPASSDKEETVTKFAVKFMAGEIQLSSQDIESGKYATAPTSPSLEGYKFLYWSLTENGAKAEVASYAITAATTFYAVFEKLPEKYDVIFMSDGVQVDKQSIEEGKMPGVPANPTKDGYKFLYWSLTDGGAKTEVSAYTVNSATTFYAVFEYIPKNYDVIFMSNGTQYSKQTVIEGNKAASPATPSLDGYKFLHWSLTDGGAKVELSSYTINRATTFYAVFEQIQQPEPETPKYEVVFISNGVQVSKQTVEKGQKSTQPGNPSLNGYKFLYWSLTDGGAKTDVSTYTINGATTFYAVFEYIPKYYDVIFMSNGRQYDKKSVKEGEYAATPANPTKDGYKFLYWSLSEDGAKTEVSTYEINGKTTFYAVFEYVPKFYDVIFMSNGAQVSKQSIKEGEYAVSPATPSLDGYEFLYWSLVSGGSKTEVSNYEINGKTTFYAVFEKLPDPIVYYDVIFMVDGEQHAKQVVENGYYASEPKEPKRDGYTFLYWSLTDGGAEVDVETKKITGKTIFYAVFEINKTNPNDQSVIDALEKAIPQFKAIRMTDTRQIRIRNLIVSTVQSVYNDAVAGIYIDKAYVNSVKEYRDAIDDVQDIVDNEMTDSDISQFISLVRNNVDKDTFNILVDYFIDEKTQDKYLK